MSPRTVWHAFGAIVLLFALWVTYGVWRDALREPAIVHGEAGGFGRYEHAWKVNGVVREAHHATSSLPDYMGTRGYSVTGHDRDGNAIWMVSGVTSHEQIR